MSDLEKLQNYLWEFTPGGIALAFSGGVDSTLLLAVLAQLRERESFALVALTMHSIFQSEDELAQVRNSAAEFGVELKLFGCDPLAIPEVKYNPPDRCYWCKRYIFSEFTDYAQARGLRTLLDGTNADDRKTYRPGLAAVEELHVLSPLARLGIDKKRIRQMAKKLGLKCADQASSPCVATRFEYGTLLTPELIRRTVDGEDLIRGFFPASAGIRLRGHADIARIEIDSDLIPELIKHHSAITSGLKSLGFQFVTLDLAGFHSGSMDYGIQNPTLEV